MTKTKNCISTWEPSRQLGMSYNPVSSVNHKLMQVMKEGDSSRPLGGWAQLVDAYWLCGPSRETLGRPSEPNGEDCDHVRDKDEGSKG